MKKMKKILTLAMTATLLFSSMTVNAATPSVTAKQNADYMMSTNKDGAPNWFNGAYYSDSHTDLKLAFGYNEKALYNHSLQYGFNEARLVTPVLDVAKYRDFYPDLNKAFGDNWKLYVRHYFEYGINEGRENFTDFDAKTYLSMYGDLQTAFGYDLGLATRHYIEYGISEGRMYNWPEPEIVYEETDNDNDENGTLLSEYTYYESGVQKTNTGYRTNGTKEFYIEYNEQGYQTLVINYEGDGITEEHKAIYTYDENGVCTYQVNILADGTRAESEFYEGGIIKKQTEFFTDGTKYIVEQWENGNLKTCTWYDASDNITRKQEYNEEGNLTYDSDNDTTATPSNATPVE